jgi:predicted RNA-binding Zn-ribbon protein involved in translation (DUF1610 family)
MSRLRQEMQLVPRPVWMIAVFVWVAFFLVLALGPFHPARFGPRWPFPAFVIAIMPGLPLFLLVLLIGYVYADARRRGMRYVMWTLLAIFIPNAIGIILYFILREPLMLHCTRCGALVRPGHAFCPRCGESLASTCPQCRRAVEPGWLHCAHCGAALTPVVAGATRDIPPHPLQS